MQRAQSHVRHGSEVSCGLKSDGQLTGSLVYHVQEQSHKPDMSALYNHCIQMTKCHWYMENTDSPDDIFEITWRIMQIGWAIKSYRNYLRGIYFKKHNVFSYFLSLLNTAMTLLIEIISRGRQELLPLLLTTWWRNEPKHQQPQY